MREILFRGKRIDNGEWAHGDLEYSRITNAAFIHTYNQDTKEYAGQLRVDPDTVGQFYRTTYCRTPEPVRLYEGDIVEGYQPYNEDKLQRGQIIWYNDDRFSLLTTNNHIEDLIVFTVKRKLGNIHDNPELIKTEKQ